MITRGQVVRSTSASLPTKCGWASLFNVMLAAVLGNGPATDYRCEEEINRIRRNANVMDLKILEANGAG